MELRHCCVLLICLLLGLPQPAWAATSTTPPALMLATPYRPGIEVSNYWVSEKLDGVRARWDGQRLQTRSGQPITPPSWFTQGWPRTAMDGELWLGNGRFDEVSSLVRKAKSEHKLSMGAPLAAATITADVRTTSLISQAIADLAAAGRIESVDLGDGPNGELTVSVELPESAAAQ